MHRRDRIITINNNENFYSRAKIKRERQIITYRMKKAKNHDIVLEIRHTFIKLFLAFFQMRTCNGLTIPHENN